MRAALTLFTFILIVGAAHAQNTEQDRIRELESQKDFQKSRLVNAKLDSAIRYMDLERFEEADVLFRYVLANMKSVTSDVTFYFGKNSYMLQKYKQSVDWLTKYIQLKGTTGQFSAEAAGWLKKSEEALLELRLAASAKASQVFSKDFTIDCGPSGKVLCPVCAGSTVVIRKDYFGEKYSTCIYCNKVGTLSCEEYNKLLRGELKGAPENR
jgi:hypothetical protein